LCADKFAADANIVHRTESQGIDDGWLGLDIGANTIEANKSVIARSKTVFWNGP
jgi:phosphoglycerate kinase